MKPPPDPRYRHRFPAEIISHAVWLYHMFSLSLRIPFDREHGFRLIVNINSSRS
jgi:transposase-like protein